ncbi:MAG: universal stress protein [Planctomycetota bacterium]
MLHLREILVPTDMSDPSTTAFPLARDIAEASGAKITLVTVVEISMQLQYLMPPVGSLLPENASLPRLMEDYIARTKAMLETYAKTLGPQCQDKIILEGGSPHYEILKMARSRRVDMIVLSTHGRTGFARLTTGSVAERIVREAPCPVLTVHAPNPKK